MWFISASPVRHCERHIPRGMALVLDQQTVELARSLELRSGAYRAPALPVELYQRSWRGDTITPASQTQACWGPRFERRSRTYEARALPTELHQRKTLEVAGRIALPMICFPPHRTKTAFGGDPGLQADALLSWLRHLTTLERKAGLEPALSYLACPEQLRKAKCRTGWQRRVLAARRLPHGASSERPELASLF